MKNRLFAAVALCVLVLNLGGSTFADTKKVNKTQTSQLAALLPASDGVATIDVKRFFNDALPTILSGNQPMLADILAKIDEMKAKTGIDVRQFEYVAAGVTAKKVTAKEYDFDPVILARGQISSAALIGAAKLAAKGKYRQERIGDRTVYIFEAKEIAKQHKPQTAAAKPGVVDKAIGRLSKEIAATAYDANTILFGSPVLVRQTIEAKTKPSAELMALLGRKEVSVVNFASSIPAGMSGLVPLDNDELGKNIDSIRFLYGSMDIIGDAVAFNMTAKTLQNAQAQGLLETLEGLKFIGKAFLGSSSKPDNQVFARMIDNAKFSVKANEVMFDLQIPQSDLSVIVGSLKAK
ncbi:MAG: hypothetical protein H7070_02500 [Saprospiraceae bacterium]|nr:hypothetical protein [Pyrinomonadaceae bacterium]